MSESDIVRRRRAREQGKPIVWVAVISIAVVLSALFFIVMSRGGGDAARASAVKPPRASTPPECGALRESAMKRHEVAQRLDRAASEVADALVKTCLDDSWSPEVRTCLDSATTGRDWDACFHQLLPFQLKSFALVTSPTALDYSEAPSCEAGAAAVTKALREDLYARRADKDRAVSYFQLVIPHVAKAFVGACTKDNWPAEVVVCVSKLVSMTDLKTCMATLSQEQQARLDKDVADALALGE